MWDETSRQQVLQVAPFQPWEEIAAAKAGCSTTAAPSMESLSAAMEATCAELARLRSHVYHCINHDLR